MFAAVNDRLKLFQVALIQLGKQAGQMVEFVQVLILCEIIIEPQHITVKAGDEKFLVPHPVHADAFQERLHLLRGSGEFQGFTDQLALVVFSQVRDVGFKQGRHISSGPGP